MVYTESATLVSSEPLLSLQTLCFTAISQGLYALTVASHLSTSLALMLSLLFRRLQ